MNLDEFKTKLSEMLYEVFGSTSNNAVIKRENVLELSYYNLKIYKNNGSFLIYFGNSIRLEETDPLKALWYIGEEIARNKIYAATVSG